MTQARPTMHGMPVSQPTHQGNAGHAQPVQHLQHVAPTAQMSSSPMMQPQPGQPAQHVAPTQMAAAPMMQPQPMQTVQHVVPGGQMNPAQMAQPQLGQPAHQNHIVNAHHIISQYQATNPHAQHALGARVATQASQQAAAGSMQPGNLSRPRPGGGEFPIMC